MAKLGARTSRSDPYKNFKFRLRWDGRIVAGVSKVSSLKRTSEAVEHRDSGNPSTNRKSPRRSKFDAVTVERGLTCDTDFGLWLNKLWQVGDPRSEAPLKDLQKDLIVETYNEAGQLARACKLVRCWVSEFSGLSNIDGNESALAIEHIKLENEGCERIEL